MNCFVDIWINYEQIMLTITSFVGMTKPTSNSTINSETGKLNLFPLLQWERISPLYSLPGLFGVSEADARTRNFVVGRRTVH